MNIHQLAVRLIANFARLVTVPMRSPKARAAACAMAFAMVCAGASANDLSATMTYPAAGAVTLPSTTDSPLRLTVSVWGTTGTVAAVQFFESSTAIGAASLASGSASSGSFWYTWANAPAGSHTVFARVTDDLGNIITSAPVTFTVDAAPVVVMSSPANGASFVAPGPIQMTVNVSNVLSGIARVRFYRNGAYLQDGGNQGSGNYGFSWQNVPAGTYVITAIATDNAGVNSAPTAPVTITVAANNPPTTSMTGPASGSTFTAPASINLTSTASDSDGTISFVRYYVNGLYFASGGGSNGSYGTTWSNVPAGTYNITTVATDNGGANSAPSAPITITVNANNAPTATMTGPANGSTYTAPASITMTSTASDSDGSISFVRYYANGALIAGAGSLGGNNYSGIWNNVPAGTYHITSVATDSGGSNSAPSAPVTVTVTSSTPSTNAPPTTAMTSPADGATFTAPAHINLASQASDTDGSISSVSYYINGSYLTNGGSAGGINYGANSWGNVPAGTYTITTVATDNSGASTLSAPITVTVNANTPPTVSMTSPANGATFKAPVNISLASTASDSDSGGIGSVGYYINGAYLTNGGGNGGNNYGGNFNNVQPGTYTITTVATDNGGAQSAPSAPVTITVTANTPPTAAMTGPASGATYTAPVNIELTSTAMDSDGSIGAVNYYVNGSLLMAGGFNGGNNYHNFWNNVPAGTYTITTVATDNGGALSAPSAPITIRVNPATQPPPVISFTAPANNSTFSYPNSIVVNVATNDPGAAVSQANVYLDGTLIAFGATTITNLSPGHHVLTATARDNTSLNQLAYAAPVNLFVYSSAPPTASMVAPADHQGYAAGSNIQLQANAGDPDGTVSQVQFYANNLLVGAGALSSGVASSGSWVSNGWTNVPKGVYAVTAQATDNTGGVTISAPITVVVGASASSVTLAGPGATYTAPASIPLTASATNAASVEFFNGATPIGMGFLASGTATSGSWVTNAWVNVPAGTYAVTAVATDPDGGTFASTPVTFTVGAATSGSATAYFVETDQIGSPRLVSDQNQQAVWSWQQGEPFGDSVPNGVSSTGNFVFNLAFPGQYRDQETNTSYNYYRDYDPGIGGYKQSDPIGLNGGINTYGYALGSPMGNSDPLGMSSLGDIGGTLGSWAGGSLGSSFGAEAGGLVGTLAGPEGTVVGAGVGGIAGANIGSQVGRGVGTAAGEWLNNLIFSSGAASDKASEASKPQQCTADCDPPKGTVCFMIDRVPPSKPHFPIPGSHYHLWQMNQSPDGKCRWNKLGASRTAPPGAIPCPFSRPPR